MLNRTLIAAIVLILAFCIGIYFYAEWQKAAFDASLPEPPPATEQAEQSEHGHSHEGHQHGPAETHQQERPPQLEKRGIHNAARGSQSTAASGHNITHFRPPKPLPAEVQARLDALLESYLDGSLTEAELEEAALEIVMEGRTLEETVQFLEEHRRYSPALAKRLSPYRAFQYLVTVDVRQNSTAEGREHAKRALAERGDPDFELRLYLARTEQDKATSIAAYRDILDEEPNQVTALAALGYRLAYDNPVEAVELLKKANRLDPNRGLQALGLAYQRLGQYDVALDYLKKQVVVEGSDINHFTRMHIGAIERGDPEWKPIAVTDTAEQVKEKGVEQHAAPARHSADTQERRVDFSDEDVGTPQHLDDSSTAAAEAARNEFEKLRAQARQELQQFLQGYTADDRMADELKTLTDRYEPHRLSRAIETLSQHGPEEGMRRLKARDPELAEQLERRMNRERK